MDSLKDRSDDELILLYSKGENRAFDALLERYDSYIHNYIRYSIVDEDTIEDIFQEVFVKVMMTIRGGKYTATGKFRQWLTRITHNLLMDHFRKLQVEARFEPIASEGGEGFLSATIATDTPNSDELMEEQETLSELYDKLTLLPLEQREVLMLRYWGDMSFREIADHTGVSINTALGRMRYALINLRKVVQQ